MPKPTYAPSCQSTAKSKAHIYRAYHYGHIPSNHVVLGVHRYKYIGDKYQNDSGLNSTLVCTKDPTGNIYTTHLHDDGKVYSRYVNGNTLPPLKFRNK